jgi:putative endonuclease
VTKQPWFVYLLECKSGRVYTGITPELNQRIRAHRVGRGALFTKMNPPTRLLAAKPFPNKRQAAQVEREVKGLSSAFKQRLAVLWSEEYPIDQATQERLSLA